jgi:hypothetical protein
MKKAPKTEDNMDYSILNTAERRKRYPADTKDKFHIPLLTKRAG